MASVTKSDAAWNAIFGKYPEIEAETSTGAVYEITAEAIKEFREPRLMTKHDASTQVPEPLKRRKLNVLATSPRTYALGRFALFHSFEEIQKCAAKPFALPQFETLDIESITSESNAINALVISGILEDFLGTTLTETFNGKMASGHFDLAVNTVDGGRCEVGVKNARIEIDGGFEGSDSVVIMEAKNVRLDDFVVRQLYYPYRRYAALVRKPIRLVFSQYTNFRYRLYEYKFADAGNYSSIALVRSGLYALVDWRMSITDVKCVYAQTPSLTDDRYDVNLPPFPQADKFERVIALCERLVDEPDGMTTEEVADFFGVVERQASYYPAACEFLGLVERKPGTVRLSARGLRIMKEDPRARQISFVEAILEHEVFRWCLGETLTRGEPARHEVVNKMRELGVCKPDEHGNQSDSTLGRRSSTVLAWIRWVLSLANDVEL